MSPEKTQRTGEKIGWTGGWLGGFFWLLLLASVRLWQGHITDGIVGLALFALAIGAILFFAPWRHPSARFRKLAAPVYLVFFASVAWAVMTSGGLEQLGLSWWAFFWILPCLLPLWTAGGRRWDDGSG